MSIPCTSWKDCPQTVPTQCNGSNGLIRPEGTGPPGVCEAAPTSPPTPTPCTGPGACSPPLAKASLGACCDTCDNVKKAYIGAGWKLDVSKVSPCNKILCKTNSDCANSGQCFCDGTCKGPGNTISASLVCDTPK